jgi:predicted SnoaL-like aldol condensation-catalyzing enzyme
MSTKDPKLVARQFNEQITAHDLNGLAALMSPEHRFIDRDGRVTVGKEAMLDAWRRFFELFPEYFNTFTRVECEGKRVVLWGSATWQPGGAPEAATWTARIEDDLVAEWRIYADNEENRRKLAFERR